MGRIVQKLRFLWAFTSIFLLGIAHSLNQRPIIGILSQQPSPSMLEGETKNYTSYIAASYVKFVESAGARAAPIWNNKEASYYKNIASSVNGILFPGGSASIYNDSGYGMAGQILYQEVLERNMKGIHLPLWGTCLGFEMLIYLSSSFVDLRIFCAAQNIALPLIPLPGHEKSKLFSKMSPSVYEIMVTQNVTSNFHQRCYNTKDIVNQGLAEEYHLLTRNYDIHNVEFLSTIEHKSLPIFGTQWHPEKNAFEWKNTEKYNSIPHSMDAIYSAQYFGNFFIAEARLNDQKFQTEEEEEQHLIYGYTPTYKGNTTGFEQIYFFEE